MDRNARIYVAGGTTLLGTALLQRLEDGGYTHIVGAPPDEPDLTCAGQVEDFFGEARPEYVFMAAGKSGGIRANLDRPAELMVHNLLVTTHILQAAQCHGVAKLLYLASSCCYPRLARQPHSIDVLMGGALEPTSEAYATAKLAGIKLCQAFQRQHGAWFIPAIPANSFGPHDDFGPDSGHVIPGLLRKLHMAKVHGDRQVTLWGTGTPRREFIFSRDLADACLLVMARYEEPEPINLGGGTALSIAEAAREIAAVVGFRGRLHFDENYPDGAPAKTLDGNRLRALGWRPATSFRIALEQTYEWFQQHVITEDPVDEPAAI